MRRVELVAIAAMAVLRSLIAWAHPALVSADSMRYRNPEDPFAVFRFDLGQGPGQLAQIIHLLPLPLAMAVQAFLAALLWGGAASVAARGLPRFWFWFMLAFANTPWWLVWDWRVLTEALTIGGMALFGAGVARWIAGDDDSTPMLAGAAVALLARPLVVPLVIGALGVALLVTRRVPRPTQGAIALAVILAFAGVQAVAFNRALVSYHYLPEPATMAMIQASDRMAARGGLPGYMDLAEKYGMPQCPAAGEIPKGFPGAAALREIQCPGFAPWLASGGLPWWAEIVHNPRTTAEELVRGVWLRGTWVEYMPSWWAPIGGPWLRHRIDAALGLITVALGLSLFRPVRALWARFIIGVGIVGYAIILVMVDGMENWRHVLPALAMLAPFGLGSWRDGAGGLAKSSQR